MTLNRQSLAEDLVGVAEVAIMAGVKTNTVSSWRERHHDFPEPLAQLAAGPVWLRDDIEVYLTRRGR